MSQRASQKRSSQKKSSQRRVSQTQRASQGHVTSFPWGDGDTLTMGQVMQSADAGYTNELLVRLIKNGIVTYNKAQPPNVVMGGQANNIKNVNNIRSTLLFVAQLPDHTLNNLGIIGRLVTNMVPFPFVKGLYQGVTNKYNSTRKNLTHKK